jgi:hypothetical protein
MNLLKRLLGVADTPTAMDRAPGASGPRPMMQAARTEPRGGSDGGPGDVVHRYFELSREIETAKRDRDYSRAIGAARATYQLLPAFVRTWKREYGSFDINTLHAVHTAPKLMAVMEDRVGIRELRVVLESLMDLHDCLSAADEAEADVDVVRRIVALVATEPGILQSTLNHRLHDREASTAGSGISNLVGWLEKAGRIQRVKDRSSYRLYSAAR